MISSCLSFLLPKTEWPYLYQKLEIIPCLWYITLENTVADSNLARKQVNSCTSFFKSVPCSMVSSLTDISKSAVSRTEFYQWILWIIHDALSSWMLQLSDSFFFFFLLILVWPDSLFFRELKKSQTSSKSYFLPRRTLEENESCELWCLPHCALCSLPWRLYFKTRNFLALLWHILVFDLCKREKKKKQQNQVCYHHCYSPSCS